MKSYWIGYCLMHGAYFANTQSCYHLYSNFSSVIMQKISKSPVSDFLQKLSCFLLSWCLWWQFSGMNKNTLCMNWAFDKIPYLLEDTSDHSVCRNFHVLAIKVFLIICFCDCAKWNVIFFLYWGCLDFFIGILIILVLNTIDIWVVGQLLYCRGGNFSLSFLENVVQKFI